MLQAQTSVNPEWLGIEDGLSQGSAACITYGADGFLWVGTKNGLSRYDGEHIEVYTHDPDDPYSLSDDSVLSLHEDDGFVMVGTQRGVNLYHSASKRFYPILLEPEGATQPGISELVRDTKGNYWVPTFEGNALYKITLPRGFRAQLETLSESMEGILVTKLPVQVLPVFTCMYGEKLLTTIPKEKEGITIRVLATVDTDTGNVSELNADILNMHALRSKYIVFKDMIVVSYWGANIFYVLTSEGIKSIETDFTVKIISLLKDSGKLLVDTNDGYYIFEENILHKEKVSKEEALAVVKNTRTFHNDATVDRSGINWIATAGYGVMKISPRQLNIETHFAGKSVYAKPFISKKGTVYFDNPTTHEPLFIPADQTEIDQISTVREGYSNVMFVQDRNDTIWGLFWKAGVLSMARIAGGTLKDQQAVAMTHNLDSPLLTYDEKTHELLIVEEADLYVYDIDQKELKKHSFLKDIGEIPNRFDVKKTTNGHYWIGTSYGLVQGIPTEDGEINFKAWNSSNGFRNDQVATLWQDTEDEHVLWVGTKGGGVHRMDIVRETIEYLNTQNGLPNDVIYGILEDDLGKLWMSSNHGIISYEKTTQEIRNFTKADGLQNDEFNTFAYAQFSDGRMAFGGIDGLNIFDPKDFDKNNNLPRVIITDLEVDNEYIDQNHPSGLVSRAVDHTKQLTLPYAKNNVTLTFSALEFTAPSKNRFTYFLEGAEEAWSHTTSDNKANYLNMSPGKYTFKIKAANGDGVWSEEVTALEIRILPPWYRTNVAYISYLLIAGFLLWRWMAYREEKIKKKELIERSRLENELLRVEISHKQKDLADFAAAISENKKWGTYLLDSIDKIRNTRGRTKGKYFDQLEEDIKNKTFIESNKVDFQDRIDLLNNQFYETVLKQYPKLSKTDLRLCTLIRLDFTTNDIALMQNITTDSVYKSRKRLRKKLQISPGVDLDVFLKQL